MGVPHRLLSKHRNTFKKVTQNRKYEKENIQGKNYAYGLSKRIIFVISQ